jgi:hypothetical protein
VDPDTLANLGRCGDLRHLGINERARRQSEGRRARASQLYRADGVRADRPAGERPAAVLRPRYHVHINTPEEDITFHDQVGYWLWEPATGLVLQTVAIPRGQVAIAAGKADPDSDRLVLTAERGQTEYGICSTAFLEHAFRTDRYSIELNFNADGTFSYVIETTLTVRGQPGSFNHRDENRLTKIAEAAPNPLMRILAAKQARSPAS